MIDLLLSLYRLKGEPRTGWRLREVENPESVADHSWGTGLLCLIYAKAAGVDANRAVSLALVHDLAEAETGDRPARFGPDGTLVPDREKISAERRAIDLLLPEESGDLHHIRELWGEYESNNSSEAAFVRDMNLVDMCIQAYIYEKERFQSGKGGKKTGYEGKLAEFFQSTQRRLSTSVGRELFDLMWDRYRSTYRLPEPPEGV